MSQPREDPMIRVIGNAGGIVLVSLFAWYLWLFYLS